MLKNFITQITKYFLLDVHFWLVSPSVCVFIKHYYTNDVLLHTKGIIYLLCEMREQEELRVGGACYLTSRQEITKVLIWYLHWDKNATSHKDTIFFCIFLYILKIENFLKKVIIHTYNIVRSQLKIQIFSNNETSRTPVFD